MAGEFTPSTFLFSAFQVRKRKYFIISGKEKTQYFVWLSRDFVAYERCQANAWMKVFYTFCLSLPIQVHHWLTPVLQVWVTGERKLFFLVEDPLILYSAETAMLVTITMQNLKELKIHFSSCLEKLLCTPAKELSETMSGGKPQIMPCWATPWSIPGAIRSSYAQPRCTRHTDSHFSPKYSSPRFQSSAQMLGRKLCETSGWMGFETPWNT